MRQNTAKYSRMRLHGRFNTSEFSTGANKHAERDNRAAEDAFSGTNKHTMSDLATWQRRMILPGTNTQILDEIA